MAVIDRVVAGARHPAWTPWSSRRPHSVRKTSSGKIRRGATRDAYLEGRLEAGRLSLAGQWVRLIARDLAARLKRLARRAGELLFATWVGLVLLIMLPVLWLVVQLASPGPVTDRV